MNRRRDDPSRQARNPSLPSRRIIDARLEADVSHRERYPKLPSGPPLADSATTIEASRPVGVRPSSAASSCPLTHRANWPAARTVVDRYTPRRRMTAEAPAPSSVIVTLAA